MSSLKHQAIDGFKWSAIQNFGTQILQLVATIVLARLLSPEDYGVVGILVVFIAVSNVLIVGGMTNSLIRDMDATEADYSTIFFYNLAVAGICYLILFFCAPCIADFYRMDVLVPVLRLSGVSLIFSAFSAVQQVVLTKELNFKVQMKISILAQLLSSAVAVVLAYLDYGVWALVWMSLISSLVTSVLFWACVDWIPAWCFSKDSFKKHFGFGSKLLISSLIDTVYNNVYPLVIGRLYSGPELGYYSRANSFASLPMHSILGVISRVTFPLLSKMQSDHERLRFNFRRIIRMVMFLVSPLMLGLVAISTPLIELLVSDKWLPCVPYLKVLCFVFLLYPIHALNLNILQVLGRSDIFLKLEVIKKILGISILCISAPFGILALCYGGLISSCLCLIINTYYSKKLLKLSLLDQLRDLLPSLFLSIIMCVLAQYVQNLTFNILFQIFLSTVVGALAYIVGARYLCSTEFNEVLAIIRVKLYGK